MRVFEKRYNVHFDAELVKAKLLHDCSLSSLFVAPAVVTADPTNSVIQYENLDCSQTLMDALSSVGRSRNSVLELLASVGSTLGAIHQITPPADAPSFLRSNLFQAALLKRGQPNAGPSNELVLQHGDFGFTNIYVTATEELLIIDPSPNHYISVHPLNLDYPELDIAILISHLTGRAANPLTLGRSALFGRAMVDAVIDGYETIGRSICRDRLRLYTRAGIDAVRQYASDGSQTHRRAILKPLSAVLSRNI